jgi:hypothetical protein
MIKIIAMVVNINFLDYLFKTLANFSIALSGDNSTLNFRYSLKGEFFAILGILLNQTYEKTIYFNIIDFVFTSWRFGARRGNV